jgi:hypothetical protein
MDDGCVLFTVKHPKGTSEIIVYDSSQNFTKNKNDGYSLIGMGARRSQTTKVGSAPYDSGNTF